jgi:hypothetical protein
MENRTEKEIILELIDMFLENKYIDNVPSSMTLSLLRHRLTETFPTLG